MDLETENRLAALLMEEARQYRMQADKEGALAYLRQPKVRGRPNSRFLTATVLGVQQANKAVEMEEMWNAREKELELDNKTGSRDKDQEVRGKRHQDSSLKGSHNSRQQKTSKNTSSSSSSKRRHEDCYSDDDSGLRDDEIEIFLNSRIKRGRGDVGSRMDDPGPYPAHSPSNHERNAHAISDTRTGEEWEERVVGTAKPSSLKLYENMKDNHASETKKERSSVSKERHVERKRRKDDKKSRKKRKKEKKTKHRHRSHE